MLPIHSDYQSLYTQFQWLLPERFNIGEAISTRWAQETPDAVAIVVRDGDGETAKVTFAELDVLANRIANLLVSRGVRPGDRVAVILPQAVETAAVHIAIYKLGAIAVPMAMLFGAEGLQYRLENSGACAAFVSSASVQKVLCVADAVAGLKTVVSIDGGGAVADLYHEIADMSPGFRAIDSHRDDPALMIYTSGTTGPPKGALHGHRVLLGHLPGVQFAHEFFPKPGDMMWTPADWAWAGGLLNVMLPSLYFGVPVVACKFDKFTAEQAWHLLAELPIRNVFIPPTALKMMKASPPANGYAGHQLRTVFSGGEAIGPQLQDWAQEVLGLHINEVYGQTECNLVLESCGALGVLKNGAIGKPVPGAQVAVIDGEGAELAANEVGDIAVRRPHPVMFLHYWDNEKATRDKFVGDWLVTGDQGFVDDEGYFHFVGRDDDIITSSGYRIGPGEIEDCLLGHEAVKLAAVVGKPDPLRTEIVVAFIVVTDGFAESDELAEDIKSYVKTRLAAHEYPREIVFTNALPLTTTGKIIRRHLRKDF